jgi:hypothetical protein
MTRAKATNTAFRYYMHDGSAAFSFELSGKLSDEAAGKLETAWRTASSVIGQRNLMVDLTYVTSIDAAGRRFHSTHRVQRRLSA